MTPADFAAHLDATNLKPDATESDIEELCREARTAGYAAVCVYPGSVERCVGLLSGSAVQTCTVANFPHGRSSTAAVQADIEYAASKGAGELDFVLPYAELLAGHTDRAAGQVLELCARIRSTGMRSKVIVETCYLDTARKRAALRICEDAGADFIKTSTGFGPAGAQLEDVRLFARERRGAIRIKASGGIRTCDQALAMIQAGADRLGVSAAGALMQALGN